jgi:hypothetical protein
MAKNYQMWQRRMATFLHSKDKILWDVTMNTTYVHPINFLAPGSRDMHDANNKAVYYLFRALCQSEFDRVQTKDLACKIWEHLKNAHTGNTQVQARLYATYWREYGNFTHLPSESIDTMFQRFIVIVNNMTANVVVLSYDDHDRDVKLLHSLDRTIWDGNVEAILEFEKYDTLTIDELFSKLESAEVDRGVIALLEVDRFMDFRTRILLDVGWIGSPLLGLASSWVLLWCLGLPANNRVLLNPLPR